MVKVNCEILPALSPVDFRRLVNQLVNWGVQRVTRSMSSQCMLSDPGMKKTLTLTTLLCGLLLFPALAWAQTQTRIPPSQMDPSTTRERPLTEMEEELRAKQAIKYAEKEHRENLDRAKEIAEIGKELKAAISSTPLLSRESQKKIERLEKLTRKVRGDAGGDDQEVEIPNRPGDVPTAITRIAQAAETLSKDVQDTPRKVVSATVIENANVLLELIRVVRTLSRQP
jgi:hypothetical protein